jgi:sodium transport system ATP-binding protein
MIEVEDLHKRFGDVVALGGVSLRAADGQVTGLLGPNGAGKTTLLRVLYTVLRPDRGAARVDGHDVTAEAPLARTLIGAVPHAHGLYARLTTREHIRYFGELHGLGGAPLERRIDDLARQLDLGEIMDRRTQGFSLGQSVKVAVARALVHDPRNVLLDEPTAGLDVMSTRRMRAFIRRLRAEGRCILFSSHLMHEVAELCDRIVVIAGGRIAAAGTPDELRRRTGHENLEDVFVAVIGSEEGLVR